MGFVICFMIWMFIYVLTAKARWQKILKAQPVLTCTGTVKEKYMRIVPAGKASRSVPHFTFEADDGQRLTLAMENEQYGQIYEGDKGLLSYCTYKNAHYFISLERRMN